MFEAQSFSAFLSKFVILIAYFMYKRYQLKGLNKYYSIIDEGGLLELRHFYI